MRKRIFLPYLFIFLSVFSLQNARAAEIIVAVASNFKPAMQELQRVFETDRTHRLKISYASTGKHYAQIMHGAPFDVFLAANALHPEKLEQQSLIVENSRRTYAIGRLVFWSPESSIKSLNDLAIFIAQLKQSQKIVIANPKLAPYGVAAEQALQQLQLWSKVKNQSLRAENIVQSYQLVATGNVNGGFVAFSQVIENKLSTKNYFLIPDQRHAPIIQQSVLLKNSKAASEFYLFLKSAKATAIIDKAGYSLPKTIHLKRVD